MQGLCSWVIFKMVRVISSSPFHITSKSYVGYSVNLKGSRKSHIFLFYGKTRKKEKKWMDWQCLTDIRVCKANTTLKILNMIKKQTLHCIKIIGRKKDETFLWQVETPLPKSDKNENAWCILVQNRAMLILIHGGKNSIKRKCVASHFPNTSTTWFPKRGTWQKEHPNSQEISIFSLHPSNFHDPLSFLVAHDIIIAEFPSTRRLKRLKAFTCHNSSKKARISTSRAKL